MDAGREGEELFPPEILCDFSAVFEPLPEAFYQPSASQVVRRLLGHFLLRRTPEGLCGGEIVETEAYLTDDPACHGFGGLTARNRSMFGPPGRAYVYLIYGMHWCVNAVCRPAGSAEAVLIRAIAASFGAKPMFARRGVSESHQLTNGPAKLCQALAITRDLDGAELWDAHSPLLLAHNPEAKRFLAQHGPVVTTTRIGISKAEDLPLRYYLRSSPFVSRRDPKREGRVREER